MCTNTVTFFIQRGHGFRETQMRCGRTDPWGGRVICDECIADDAKRREAERAERNIALDNAAARSAGWGEF